MHPQQLAIADYTYHLPEERIAHYPLQQRDASKLLVYRKGEIISQTFKHIAEYLPQNALMVFNNSKVVAARLIFEKETGGMIEVFALEPHESYADITTAMNTTHTVLYKCLVGGASKWKMGMVLQKKVETEEGQVTIEAAMIEKRNDCFIIRFTWLYGALPFAKVLQLFGQIPIPPYLQRAPELSDSIRYQTLYAKTDGSVAAPTAGLHFTPAVFHAIAKKNIKTNYVTLHVGAGTFMPVKAEVMQAHQMHAEFIDVHCDLIHELQQSDVVIPVGTTSMRTLESLYWMGAKTFINPDITMQELAISQWEVYEKIGQYEIAKADALQALKNWMKKMDMQQLVIKTQIMIAPGYRFKICRGLVTNFHQPNSTLLLLVAALVGSQWKNIYDYALQEDFRFLSYGDSCLLLP